MVNTFMLLYAHNQNKLINLLHHRIFIFDIMIGTHNTHIHTRTQIYI